MKVLVVEDDGFLRQVYRQHLEIAGYDVLDAPNGEEAMQLSRAEKPDIVLLDIVMPGRDGLDFLKEFKNIQALKNIPVVMLTNISRDNERDHALELGAAEYVIKSEARPEEIADIVERNVNG